MRFRERFGEEALAWGDTAGDEGRITRALYRDWKDDTVADYHACPRCEENRTDKLVLGARAERVTCTTCGNTYRIRA